MWDDPIGHNMIRLLDQNNHMKRHYGALKNLDKSASSKSKFFNKKYSLKQSLPRRPSNAVIKRQYDIYLENQRLIKALDKLNSKFGQFNSDKLNEEYETYKKKTIFKAFNTRKKQELEKSNQRYQEKVKRVKPVYNNKVFEKEKKSYIKIKKKLNTTNHKFRDKEIKAIQYNTKEVSKYQKQRAQSANIRDFLGDNPVAKKNKFAMVSSDKVLLLSKPVISSSNYSMMMNQRPMTGDVRRCKSFSSNILLL